MFSLDVVSARPGLFGFTKPPPFLPKGPPHNQHLALHHSTMIAIDAFGSGGTGSKASGGGSGEPPQRENPGNKPKVPPARPALPPLVPARVQTPPVPFADTTVMRDTLHHILFGREARPLRTVGLVINLRACAVAAMRNRPTHWEKARGFQSLTETRTGRKGAAFHPIRSMHRYNE